MIPGLQSAKGRKPNWEELRKEARFLENQIDGKLVDLSKLGTSLSGTGGGSFRGVSDKTPLMAEEEDKDQAGTSFKTVCDDLTSLLAKLTSVNEALTEWAASTTTPSSPAVHHTLQRHQDILKDYKQEFSKTRSNVNAAIERHDLLDSVHKDINDYRSGSNGGSGSNGAGTNRRMELLLKESEHARNSERLIDEHISIAVEARETLVNQRMAFKAIQAKLNDISTKNLISHHNEWTTLPLQFFKSTSSA